MLSYAAQSEARNASNCETQQPKVRKQRAAARQNASPLGLMVNQLDVKMPRNSVRMRVVLALSLLSCAAAGVAQVDYFFGSK